MIRALIFTCSLLLCLPAFAADKHVGMVKNVSGSVSVQRGAQTLSAEPGMHVYGADRIQTGDQSSAGIMFIDGTRITVGAASDVDLRQYQFDPRRDQYGFSLYIKRGEAIYSSGRMGKLAPEQIKLETPRATVGVRGTRMIVKVD